MDNAQIQAGAECRFVAVNMTQALRQLTDALGSDAILLSSRKLDRGVEVIGLPAGTSALPDNINQMHTERRKGDRRRQPRNTNDVRKNDGDEQSTHQKSSVKFAADLRKTASELAEKISHLTPAGSTDYGIENEDFTLKINATDSVVTSSDSSTSQQLSTVTQELKSLKVLIANSMTSVSEDFLPQPHEYVVLNRLMQSDLSAPLVRALVQTARGDSAETLWEDSIKRLKALISIVPGVEASRSGIIAVVGACASGKTETVIKMAAKLALQHGRQSVVVLATEAHCSDHSALRRMSELTNISLIPVMRDVDWKVQLENCARYKYVLIDTSLSSELSDTQLLTGIRESGMPVDEILTLPANAEKRYLQQIVADYHHENTLSTTVTFYDRCVAKGELLSILICEKLSIMYLSTGVLLPEFLQQPCVDELLADVLEKAVAATDVLTPLLNQQIQDESELLSS